MANLGPLSTLPTTATALGNLILVTPKTIVGYQPQSAPLAYGVSPTPTNDSIVFHYEGEQTVLLESDITDHFVEDNSAIQDQISIRPEIITTHGYIGELNDIIPSSLEPLQALANKITIISGYAPGLSVTALSAIAQAVQSYNTVNQLANSAISAWNSLPFGSGNQETQNKQQVAFNTFRGYWLNRTLFTVQTPWSIFTNCAIKSLRAIQDPDTQIITDFEVTFKAMRFSSTVIAGGIQLGQSYFNNYLGSNNPTLLGASAPSNLGASLGSNVGKITGVR